jgi:hypothetical protein
MTTIKTEDGQRIIIDATAFTDPRMTASGYVTAGMVLSLADARELGERLLALTGGPLPVRQPTPEAAAAAERVKRQAEPDDDGQIRPCGARLYGCYICGESYADPTQARECCTSPAE